MIFRLFLPKYSQHLAAEGVTKDNNRLERFVTRKIVALDKILRFKDSVIAVA